MSGLSDGSPSTEGVDGVYSGGWDEAHARPHGLGTMAWANGITYAGEWRDGVYHGRGAKLYSKGGGYDGEWVEGKRQGWGTSFYDGKWGYDRWVGPFEDDLPHGVGTMYDAGDPGVEEFSRFDLDGDGTLSRDEVVGRLCGEYGVRHEDATALFLQCDNDGNGVIDVDEFCAHYDDICEAIGGAWPQRPDQRPGFEFVRGEPAAKQM